MKKIFLLFLFVSSFGFSQEEDYSKIFSNFDSIQKTNLYDHINRVINLANYVYATEKKPLDVKDSIRNILFTIKLDTIGKLNLIFNNENNEQSNLIFHNLFEKIPPILTEKNEKNKNKETYISASFKLHNNLSSEKIAKIKFDLFEKSTDTLSKINSLSIYPSFGNFKKNTNKEKSIKDFSKNLSVHINKHFKYPDYAQENGITGKTFVYFLIEKDGSVERILSYNGHPILQHAGIEIINKLPKLNPGYIDGQTVRVVYGLPLTFKLQ